MLPHRNSWTSKTRRSPTFTLMFRDLVGSAMILVSLCVVACNASAAGMTASVDQREGLPSLSLGGASVMSSAFVFWGKNWKWAQLKTQFKVVAPFDYTISGTDQLLNFDLSGRITKSSDRQLVWTLDLDAATTMTDVIGGGVAFKLDLANFVSELGEPELLPDNRGWSWGRPGRTQVEMRFDFPLAKVYFERGQKSQIRALFYNGVVPQGRQHIIGRLTVSGDTAIVPTAAERFGSDNNAAWLTNILDWATAPVDLSFLNASERPAGKHGFLKAVKDRLVFEDGTPARFWGTNVVAYSLFATNSYDVKRQARRLSELGFNLVRLHHIDFGLGSSECLRRRGAGHAKVG